MSSYNDYGYSLGSALIKRLYINLTTDKTHNLISMSAHAYNNETNTVKVDNRTFKIKDNTLYVLVSCAYKGEFVNRWYETHNVPIKTRQKALELLKT